jgi:hypothetical protein
MNPAIQGVCELKRAIMPFGPTAQPWLPAKLAAFRFSASVCIQ